MQTTMLSGTKQHFTMLRSPNIKEIPLHDSHYYNISTSTHVRHVCVHFISLHGFRVLFFSTFFLQFSLINILNPIVSFLISLHVFLPQVSSLILKALPHTLSFSLQYKTMDFLLRAFAHPWLSSAEQLILCLAM